MEFKSILKPDGSVLMGIATAALVAVIFAKNTANTSVIHATPANDQNVNMGRQKATLTSIGVLSFITLITKDVNVFILGGLTTVALDFNCRHANAVAPGTNTLVSGTEPPASQLRVVSN